MSQHTAAGAVPSTPSTPRTPRMQTAQTTPSTRLLAAGVVAGPLFIAMVLIQAFTRDGFDLTRHPISLLSLGDLGWVQIGTFVVTGLLYLACAVGTRRALRPGRGGTWGPVLIGAVGLGLIVAGVFVTDAGAGYPAGAPAGAPEISWHGLLHEIGFILTALSWTAACVVFARRSAALTQRGWVAACVAAVVTVLLLTSWPDLDSLSVRLVLASAVQFGFLSVVAAHLKGGLPVPDATSSA